MECWNPSRYIRRAPDGTLDGTLVGILVGLLDGIDDGMLLGALRIDEGTMDGTLVGIVEGCSLEYMMAQSMAPL